MGEEEYDDCEDAMKDWWYHEPKVTHTCQGCQQTFQAQAARGPLAYCDACADKIEQGWDLYE